MKEGARVPTVAGLQDAHISRSESICSRPIVRNARDSHFENIKERRVAMAIVVSSVRQQVLAALIAGAINGYKACS